MSLIDLSGQVIGQWTVISRATNGSRSRTRWLCQCSCGLETAVNATALRSGKSAQCQTCARLKQAGATHASHPDHPLYIALTNARRRCEDPDHPDYPRYGGRGIRVSITFLDACQELGPRPTPAHTLDRIDNSRGYESGNLRWATRREQAWNRRRRSDGSGFIGVQRTRSGRFSATLAHRTLGTFDHPEVAACVYDFYAARLRGAQTVTNFNLARIV